MRVLMIGYVWPEPSSSAAGRHFMSLAKLLAIGASRLCIASAAERTEYSANFEVFGFESQQLEINSASFDEYVSDFDPQLVVFDRFMTEEQFGWRVAKACPNALKILDTEDLQSLREERRRCVMAGEIFQTRMLLSAEKFKREIAAIHRSDLSLIISPYEHRLLIDSFNVPQSHLVLLPFLVEADELSVSTRPLSERNGAVAIGNFRHAPNWDSVRELYRLWPRIRERQPSATISIFGAYLPPKAMQLNQPQIGFCVKGRAEDALKVIGEARLLLAPLRFGAGLKGKLLEAAIMGTPSVTSAIGAEGMLIDSDKWPGVIANDDDHFVEAAVRLFRDDDYFHECQRPTKSFVSQFKYENWAPKLKERLAHILELGIENHRQGNLTGLLMNYHGAKSYQFMSQWIQVKTEFAAFRNAVDEGDHNSE
ncbi:glycosyltransferase [Umboniibacter marinipuniceus]|uniref:Glycosyltransferase involved in cell wall biosynthesis n=1 Tax=Umboniibacter marinipuniceus TaxID=569599 RepID=A0A3M0A582_9GAMM|nr:glycosyltransferase [Umboniibacter marinipuniceus]RMA79930.1 glycosyltransferase involved in cell wall biosynthesis [Umboniibacter marinipuniceus]